MPDFDPFAVLAAWNESLISREEAREALGFHDEPEDGLADLVVELQVERARLHEEVKANHATIEQLRAERTAAYVDGFDAGVASCGKYHHGKLPTQPGQVKPTWVGYPPNTTVRPWPGGRTFTVNTAGEATVQTPP